MSVASAELLFMLMPLAAVGAILLGHQQQRLAVLKRESAALARALGELQSVFERAPLGLAIFDRDLRYVRINQLLADINGAGIDEHLGKTLRDMVPDIADAAEGRLHHVLRSGQPSTGVVFAGTTAAQPGTMRTWRESLFPMLDRDRRPQGVLVTVEEITEQQRLGDALRQSQQREHLRTRELECVLHACPAGMVIASDRACRHARANGAAERLLRLERGETPSLSAPGAHPFALYADGRQLAPDQLPLQRAAASGEQTWDSRLTVRFDGADDVSILVNAVPLRDENGDLAGAVAGFLALDTPAPRADGPPLASGVMV